MNKKRLFKWEIIMIITAITVFISVFSLQGGWGLTGAERYEATGAASLAVVATAVATGVVAAGVVALAGFVAIAAVGVVTAGVVIAAAIAAVATAIVAGVRIVGVIAIATVGVIAVGVIAAGIVAAGNSDSELKSCFLIPFLILKVLLISGTMLAITFWPS